MMTNIGTVVTGLGAIVGAVATALQYFKFTTRRDKLAAARKAFDDVVASLASTNEIDRLAGAILLRRFFDPTSEVATKGTPYATEAINVIAAILRGQPASNFQKLLADGLSFAPSLRGADLQRTNLHNAYLGSRGVRDGRWEGPEVFVAAPLPERNAAPVVYVSKPGCLDARQERIVTLVRGWLESSGLTTCALERSDYPATGALAEVRRRMSNCAGVVAFGFAELQIVDAVCVEEPRKNRNKAPERHRRRGLRSRRAWRRC